MGLQAVLGGVLVAYGIAKIALAVVDETPSLRARVPYLDAHYDGSTAGHALRAFLVAFGVYTVVHGLALLQVLPAAVGSFAATFAVYGTIGVLMTAFFGLVVYGPRGVNRDPAYAGDAILVQSHWVKALRLAEGAVGRTMPALRVAAIDGKVSGKRRYEIEQDMAGGGVDVLFLSIGVRAYVHSCSIRARVRALAGVPAGARDVGVMLLLRRHVTRAGGGRRRQRA